MAKKKTEEEKELQRLLVTAEKAIQAVTKHAEKHDLSFQINGVRYGYMSGNIAIPDNELEPEDLKDGLTREFADLDLDSEWVGSWC